MTNSSVSGSRVLVIGAAGGIGAATAQIFSSAGATVIAAGRSAESLEPTTSATGSQAAVLDILDADALEKFFSEEAPFDHVVVAASSTKNGRLDQLTLAEAKSSMDSKFFGAYRTARAARVSDGGSITFVSGFLSNRPKTGSVLQGAINAAVDGLARGLAIEMAPVRVNSVSPGLIDTPLWKGIPEKARDEMFARAAETLPVRRVGRAEDIAQAIFFAATSSFVTGTCILVDGGGTIC